MNILYSYIIASLKISYNSHIEIRIGMLQLLTETYNNYYRELREKYANRIYNLKSDTSDVIKRYYINDLPLYTRVNHILELKTMKDIENDIMTACENGISFVQYKVHKHYYPGYIGDNISF